MPQAQPKKERKKENRNVSKTAPPLEAQGRTPLRPPSAPQACGCSVAAPPFLEASLGRGLSQDASSRVLPLRHPSSTQKGPRDPTGPAQIIQEKLPAVSHICKVPCAMASNTVTGSREWDVDILGATVPAPRKPRPPSQGRGNLTPTFSNRRRVKVGSRRGEQRGERRV